MSGSGISWAICKSAPQPGQITTPAPHHSVFFQAGCPSCHPTNNVKALKAKSTEVYKYVKYKLETTAVLQLQPFYDSLDYVRDYPGEPVPER